MSNVNRNEMLVGLDIGTSKVVAVVAEINSEGSMEIVGLGTHPSKGLKNGAQAFFCPKHPREFE